MKNFLLQKIRSRQGGAWLLALTYIILGTVLRLGFLVASASEVTWSWTTFAALLIGFLFDIAMAGFFATPFAFISSFCKSERFRLFLIPLWCFGVFLFTFWKISEILFWQEFAVRFNFIAVDYLVYTSEVVKNIRESYNMPLIFLAVFSLAAGFYFLWRKCGYTQLWSEGVADDSTPRWWTPLVLAIPVLVIPSYSYFVGKHDLKKSSDADSSIGERVVAGLRHMGDIQPSFANSYETEIAKNGEYSFLTAFWANQLEWRRFYPSRDNAPAALREILTSETNESKKADITREIKAPGSAQKYNVIQITIESLSAEFLSCYRIDPYFSQKLTPNLDRISGESLWFRHCYAGGTRTVRGMEGLTLSIPPIPGQSVLRRRGCENLTTLGSVLNHEGYDSAFIYGGDGFFDNMNYFFSTNGYRVVDLPRQLAAGKKTTFENAWGACDEDAFNWSLDEADKSFAVGKPFHHFIMTTSNHRPYTWPSGKIDPKLQNREGGVAYTDFAIGAFLKAAESKPWFKNTVFVIVADHCASVAGKQELEIKKYEIPLFIWAPGLVKPQVFEPMMSQIDTVPTLLGLMNISYTSRFVGADVMKPDYQPRAFISNYQKVAVLRPNGLLTVLKPVRQVQQYWADLGTGSLKVIEKDKMNSEATDEALRYYQGTDELFNHGGLLNPAH